MEAPRLTVPQENVLLLFNSIYPLNRKLAEEIKQSSKIIEVRKGEEYHNYLINAIIKNCFIRDLYGDSKFLFLEINKIVDESIITTYNKQHKNMLGY